MYTYKQNKEKSNQQETYCQKQWDVYQRPEGQFALHAHMHTLISYIVAAYLSFIE